MPSDHYERRLEEVAGWFAPVDQVVFECLLSWQSRTQPAGDAVELGVFEGKSAIHIARFLRPGERLTVCDLFDDAATQEEVHPAARHFYRTLAQSTFEKNFLQFHHDLPHIVRCFEAGKSGLGAGSLDLTASLLDVARVSWTSGASLLDLARDSWT